MTHRRQRRLEMGRAYCGDEKMTRLMARSPPNLMQCLEGNESAEAVSEEREGVARLDGIKHRIGQIAHQRIDTPIGILPKASLPARQANNDGSDLWTELFLPPAKRRKPPTGVRKTEKTDCIAIGWSGNMQHRLRLSVKLQTLAYQPMVHLRGLNCNVWWGNSTVTRGFVTLVGWISATG